MSRYAVLCDGQVTNVIAWDGKTEYDPGEGCRLINVDARPDVSIGWTKAGNGRWVAPAEPLGTDVAPVPLTVDPAAVAALVDAVQQPDADVRQALADFASALSSGA